MEVSRYAFNAELPNILHAISNAHFVSIDLELSGIHTKPKLKWNTARQQPGQQGTQNGQQQDAARYAGGKQSMQQRYAEAKEAAEKYHILQIGLTCVTEDAKKAVEFLLSHGFQMEKPFLEGVPYLSRPEEVDVRKEEALYQTNDLADLTIRETDLETVRFLDYIRAQITAFKSNTVTAESYLNISPENFSTGPEQNPMRGFNNFQKRLVHQLVRAEYPDLVSISRRDFIQLKKFDKEREALLLKAKIQASEERIHRQIGIRWVFEALVGGDLSQMDAASFAQAEPETPDWIDLTKYKANFEKLRVKLAKKKTVLVGHNLLVDLINFYHAFFGPLPEKLEDFAKLIHGLFPIIVDTKFLATQSNDAANARSGLEELDERCSKQQLPSIEVPAGHDKYTFSDHNHEAGYDAFLTAKVMIRLSAFLEAEGTYLKTNDGAHTNGENGVMPNGDKKENQNLATPSSQPLAPSTPTQKPITAAPPTTSQPPKANKSYKQNHSQRPPPTAFSHSTMFDALADIPISPDSSPEPRHRFSHPQPQPQPQTTPSKKSRQAPSATPSTTQVSTNNPRNEGQEKEERVQESQARKKEIARLMPAWDDPFWDVHANRLRLNGTIEGVCCLDPR
ncbi:hypothetical protein MMC25_001998 [Agyrium rufum]|nr:hypothetical protein [Agyrium rufum]